MKSHELKKQTTLLIQLTKKIPLFKKANPSEITLLKKLDGWSNDNYLILFNNQNYVLRSPIASEEEGVNRKAELINTNLVAEAGICSEFIYFENSTGICLRKFIEGSTPIDNEEHISTDSLRNIAITLKKLHTLPKSFQNKVDNFSIISNTIKYIENYSNIKLSEYDHLIKLADETKAHLISHPVKLVPCHNDPNPRNFLNPLDENNFSVKTILLDWEYSGNGDPAWDLAYFIAHSDLDKESETQFLNQYFDSTIPEDLYHRIVLYKPITLLVFSLWIKLERVKGHTPIDINELVSLENELNDKIASHFESDQHRRALEALPKHQSTQYQPITYKK